MAVADIAELVQGHEERLETLSSRFDKLEAALRKAAVLTGGNESGTLKSLLPAEVQGLDQMRSEREVFQIELLRVKTSLGDLRDSLEGRLERAVFKLGFAEYRKQFPFSQSNPVSGIIAYLNSRCAGNIHDKGLVEVTASSIEGSSSGDPRLTRYPKYVTTLTDTNRFGTCDRPGSWLKFDFKDMWSRPTHYTLVTDHRDEHWLPSFALSWVIQGSIDGMAWQEMDRKTGRKEMAGPDRTVSFEVANPMKCRYVRMDIIGRTHNGRDYLEMRYIDFFGELCT
jgi:hypothetical protein